MNVSNELKSQLDRLANTGAFSINLTLKKELRQAIEQVGGAPFVNFNCGTCARDAMHRLNAHLKTVNNKPVLQKMKMVKEPKDMTFIELKKAVKDKGITLRTPTKQQLIEALS